MLGLLGINMATKSDWWVQWPLLGWGLGILGHAIGVFMPINYVGRDWEERKIKERLAKNTRHAPGMPLKPGSTENQGP